MLVLRSISSNPRMIHSRYVLASVFSTSFRSQCSRLLPPSFTALNRPEQSNPMEISHKETKHFNLATMVLNHRKCGYSDIINYLIMLALVVVFIYVTAKFVFDEI